MTNATDFTAITIDMPDVPSGSVRFSFVGPVGVNSVYEVIPPKSRYIFNLDANGVASGSLPVPDSTGAATWRWFVEKFTGQGATGTTAVGCDRIAVGWDVAAQELGVLLLVDDTAIPPEMTGVTPGQASWLAAEIEAIDAATDGNLLQSDGTNSQDSGIATADVLVRDASIVAVSTGRDLASSDAGKILECNGTFSLNCPNGLDTGFQVALFNVGSGVITITASTTLQSKDAAVTITSQYAAATLYHRGSNVWLLAGDLG